MRKMILGLGLLIASALSFSDIESMLTQRIDKMEKLKVISWMDFAYYGNDKVGNVNGFDQHHVYFTIDNQVSEKLRGLFTLEYEHGLDLYASSATTVRGAIKMDSAFISYKLDDQTTLKFGRLFNPIGFWLPTHWAILMETQEKPLWTKNTNLPLALDGVALAGSMYGDDLDIQYSAAIFNGVDMATLISALDANNEKGALLDVRAVMPKSTVGASLFLDTRKTLAGTDTGYIGYASLDDVAGFNLRGEGLMLARSYSSTAYVGYINANYPLAQNWLVSVRYDLAKDILKYTTAVGDTKTMITYALRFKPEADIQFRAEASFHNEPTSTYMSYGLSTALLF